MVLWSADMSTLSKTKYSAKGWFAECRALGITRHSRDKEYFVECTTLAKYGHLVKPRQQPTIAHDRLIFRVSLSGTRRRSNLSSATCIHLAKTPCLDTLHVHLEP